METFVGDVCGRPPSINYHINPDYLPACPENCLTCDDSSDGVVCLSCAGGFNIGADNLCHPGNAL